MATDIAANSDSTLTYWQLPSSPFFTIAERRSTMCVCGEMGYAQMTSGLQYAIACATAWDPSTCCNNRGLLDQVVRGRGSSDVAVGELAPELLSDGRGDGVEGDHAADR